MKQSDYQLLENYMHACMADSAHDREHVYRVLYTALELAESEHADKDVVVAAALLHDIGRREQAEYPALCHAQVGVEKAQRFLDENGFAPAFTAQVVHCIAAHRFRGNNPPRTVEAKVLFDADKLDATGALGVARTLLYNGSHGEPLYTRGKDGCVLDGSTDGEAASFFQEYCFKLKNVYSKLLTEKGRQMAESRRHSAEAFYESLLNEVRTPYELGQQLLAKTILK